MPIYSASELKGERGQIAVPGPFGGQFRHDRIDPILWIVLFEQNQVIKNRHHRILG